MSIRVWAIRLTIAATIGALFLAMQALLWQEPIFLTPAVLLGLAAVPAYRFGKSGPDGERGAILAMRSRMYQAQTFTVKLRARSLDALDQPDFEALAASHGYAMTEPWHRIRAVGGIAVEAAFSRPAGPSGLDIRHPEE